MKTAESQQWVDRIIKEEMLRCGAAMCKARSWAEWEAAHLQLEELGKVCKAIWGKTPYLESGLTVAKAVRELGSELEGKGFAVSYPVRQGGLF